MRYIINENPCQLPYYLRVLLALLLFSGCVYAQEEISVDSSAQTELSLTVYNHDLALVRDVRNIDLVRGLNKIALKEVSARIRPETVIINSPQQPSALRLLEQNFDYDLLTPQQLLQKYVGQQVRVIKTHPTTGAEVEQPATVLSANNGVVLRIGDRIETGIPGRIVYDNIPENLRDRPTLSLLAESNIQKQQPIEISYLSSGLSWKADYVAKLSSNEKTLDLNGWVTLSNQSGTSYKNANLQLVAGDVNQAPNVNQLRRVETLQADLVYKDNTLQEESLFEYHLYSLGRQTDILQNQTKQVALLSASNVPVQKDFLLQGQPSYYFNKQGLISDQLKVGVYVEFENKKQNNLGIPLPKGVMRVYKDDSSANTQFIGEDRIDHTPKNERIRLKLGDAFDVTATKKQTSYKKEAAFGKYRHAASSAYEIEIHNAKQEEVTVRVLEPVPGDWKMNSSSLKHSKVNANTAQWLVTVPAEKRVTLSYEVLVRY